MLPLGEIEFGGGIVRQRFTTFDKTGKPRDLPAGHRLTAEEVRGMANHRSLISSGRIAVYPKTVAADPASSASTTAERHVVHRGGGRYDVFAGVKLNDHDMSKEEAEELASRSN